MHWLNAKSASEIGRVNKPLNNTGPNNEISIAQIKKVCYTNTFITISKIAMF
jgi:hypothetical protein